MLATDKLSLCPECTACPEVEILRDEGQPVSANWPSVWG